MVWAVVVVIAFQAVFCVGFESQTACYIYADKVRNYDGFDTVYCLPVNTIMF